MRRGPAGCDTCEHVAVTDSARIDSWLWAVRVLKTRNAAKTLIDGGHVSVNGNRVKPGHRVKPGDRIEALVAGHRRDLEVVEAIEKRVGADRAVQCLIDRSPPRPDPVDRPVIAERDRGTGRPTKRDRRQIDRFRGG